MSDFSLALCKKIGTVSIHKTMLFRSPSRSKLSISICIFRKACFVSYAFPHALQPFVNVIFRNLVKCFIVKSARRIRQIMLWDLRKYLPINGNVVCMIWVVFMIKISPGFDWFFSCSIVSGTLLLPTSDDTMENSATLNLNRLGLK